MEIDLSSIQIIHTVNGYDAASPYYEFLIQARKEAFSFLIDRVWGGWDEDLQRDILVEETRNRQPNIIFYKDQPIGSYCLTKKEDCYHFENFFILPKYQKKGIGSFVLKKALETVDKERLPIRLVYWNFNPAGALYEKMGFEITGRQEFEGTKDYWVKAERKPVAIHQPKRKYKAIIFDLFGTLVDIYYHTDYYSVLREMMSVLKAPHDDFMKLWRDTSDRRVTGVFRTLEENLEYICRELNLPTTRSQINLAKRIRLHYVSLALTPREGVIEVLSRLKSDGYKIALVSNCSAEPPVIWPYTSFAPFFDVTVFSSVAGIQKPDPRIYRMATEQLKVKPEDCLYIGDGDSHELTGAAGVGMHPVLIRAVDEDSASAVRISSEIDNYACPVISSLREVLDLL